jgi:hypothetical protein
MVSARLLPSYEDRREERRWRGAQTAPKEYPQGESNPRYGRERAAC